MCIRDSYQIRPWTISRTVHDGDTLDLGGRTLEVLATPGHTPDSLMLLDRKHRELFTGDMYYDGPIYLFVPETNAADYVKSIARVAKLVPEIDVLLCSHNFPLSQPKQLIKVREALHDIQTHRAKGVLKDGFVEYPFEGFSLISAPATKAAAP